MKNKRSQWFLMLGIVLVFSMLFSLSAALAAESSYPTKTVRIIVTFGAGTGLDAVTRFVADRLPREWNVSVVVENRAGASGTIAANAVASAQPDGYTLLAISQVHYSNATLFKNLPYDPFKFVPIVRLTGAPLVIVAASKASFNNVKTLIAEAKANPQKISFASLGSGSSAHMAGALFNFLAGSQLVHVPYKETTQAVVDTIAGRVSINFVTIPTGLGHIKSGKLKAIAVTGTKRSATLPDIPTVAESGLPGYEFVPWHAWLAPPETPSAIVEKISASVVRAAQAPDFRPILENYGLDLILDGSADFAAKLPAESARLAKLIELTGAKRD